MTDIMPNHEQWAVVPVFNGKPPSDAIVWGSISEVMEYIGQTQARAEADERLASAQQQLKADARTLAQAQQITADTATKLTAMGSAMVAAKEKQARKDAEAKRVAAEQAEAKRVQDLLDKLPDPDNPNAASGDDGDLQSPHHPPDKEHHNPEADGITGSFPTRLEKEAPRGGEYMETDIEKLAYPQKPQQQPVAISLNEV
jgi:hypothetical protein